MPATIIDGKAVAAALRANIAARVATLAFQPGLVVVLVGDDPASAVYVRNKDRAAFNAGLRAETIRLPASTPQSELLATIDRLNQDPAIDGILVQLPLPPAIDARTVIAAIDPAKDVDGFHPINVGRLHDGIPGTLAPCTPTGVMRLLAAANIPIRGARALVLGRSAIVGKPMAALLLAADANRHHRPLPNRRHRSRMPTRRHPRRRRRPPQHGPRRVDQTRRRNHRRRNQPPRRRNPRRRLQLQGMRRNRRRHNPSPRRRRPHDHRLPPRKHPERRNPKTRKSVRRDFSRLFRPPPTARTKNPCSAPFAPNPHTASAPAQPDHPPPSAEQPASQPSHPRPQQASSHHHPSLKDRGRRKIRHSHNASSRMKPASSKNAPR